MAIVKIFDVKANLWYLIHYIMNPEKTTSDDEQCMYVSGLNCNCDTAYGEMMATKQMYQKQGGILAFHTIQSFNPNEITAETAHKIGVEFAQAMWGDRFEIVVGTHLDHEHIHNHIAINSVSLSDGKRYYDNKKNYRKMRKLNDELCKKYQLSVIEHPKGKGKPYAVWLAEKNGKPTKRTLICEDVELVISKSVTFSQFLHHLKDMGYLMKTNRKYISISPPSSNKFFRLANLTQDNRYAEEAIKERILSNKIAQKNDKTRKIYHCQYRGSLKKSRSFAGLRALYIRYEYKMGALPKNAPNRKVHFLLKEDLIYIDKITAEVTLMSRKGISTLEQLEECKLKAKEQMDIAIAQRTKCYNKLRRCSDQTKIENTRSEISQLSDHIRKLRKEVVLYESIKKRSENIQQKLAYVNESEKGKEREQNERKR